MYLSRARRFFSSLVSALAMLSVVGLACAQEAKSATPEQTKATITKALNDFLTFNSDPAQHDRWWADDLVYTTSGGLVKTKPMIMQSFADAAKPGAPKAEPQAHYSAEDVLVRLYGETAALTFRLVARNAERQVAGDHVAGHERAGAGQVAPPLPIWSPPCPSQPKPRHVCCSSRT